MSVLRRALRALPAALLLAAALLAPVPAAAQTTLLDFSGVTSADLIADYGDNVSGPSTGGYAYTGTGGFTPNVRVNLASFDDGGVRALRTWPSGYSDLDDIVYAFISGGTGITSDIVVTLAAGEGHVATLRGFDLGNFGQAVILPRIRVEDGGGTILWEELDVALPSSTGSARSFTFPAPPAAPVLTLRVSLDGLSGLADNVGLDNLEIGELPDPSLDLGSSYCATAPNSTLGTGRLRALGSASVAANDVTLSVTDLPIGQFLLFLAATEQAFVPNPGGSAGNLCLGGSIGRFLGPGQVQSSQASGTVRLALDLGAIPGPSSLLSVQAGETWNFQAWYRDGGGSNFTEAVAVDFVP
ncbi:MAG: hypothetical protein AAFP86_18520 [Planctomycetota bacterium]